MNFTDAIGEAVSLLKKGEAEEAARLCRELLKASPDNFNALHLLGIAVAQTGDFQESVELLSRAIRIREDVAGAHSNLGKALIALSRNEEAIASCERALALDPSAVEAQANLAIAQSRLSRYGDAIASYQRLLELRPDSGRALGALAALKRRACDWSDFSELTETLNAFVARRKAALLPFTFLCFSDDPAMQKLCAENYAKSRFKNKNKLDVVLQPRSSDRISIAYLSANFEEHPTAVLTAELFERHDRTHFQVHGISYGANENGSMRRRLTRAFEHFHDLHRKDDQEIARFIRELRIMIAIDLDGYTTGSRPAILSYRPAPIQINYLGYAGTMGAEHVDYILADPFIVPEAHRRFFTEHVIHLPNCYQVNGKARQISDRIPSRDELGLPKDGFVFCCFNNFYKIIPAIFDVWMRLLHRCPESVLWLMVDIEAAKANLCREAEKRKIDPRRLVFAPRVDLPEHLTRHKQADLFLDTFPYNAHTTASDALWMALPIVTYAGRSFASRVAGSCLKAVGLPELVTESLDDYERLALKLAQDRRMLRQYRRHLEENRDRFILFDCERFTRNLESAYLVMWKYWRSGKEPAPFQVEDRSQSC